METCVKTVNVSKLRQKLPEYLSLARKGETVRITSRNRTIAQLTPPPPDAREVEAARARLKGSILRYDNPLDPVFDPAEWDINK
jgi:prevent-host-death family protein